MNASASPSVHHFCLGNHLLCRPPWSMRRVGMFIKTFCCDSPLGLTLPLCRGSNARTQYTIYKKSALKVWKCENARTIQRIDAQSANSSSSSCFGSRDPLLAVLPRATMASKKHHVIPWKSWPLETRNNHHTVGIITITRLFKRRCILFLVIHVYVYLSAYRVI